MRRSKGGPARGREAGPARMEAGRRARRPGRGGGRTALVAEVDLQLALLWLLEYSVKKCLFSSLYREGKLPLPLQNANGLLKSA